ncbi:MAG TPA: hypothetical protein VFA66_08890 [Gaiellaceae bacterium]|nr:hypothetical protein [Gaiellaceae bacterium]
MKEKSTALAALAGALLASLLALPGANALEKPGTVTITDAELRHAHVDSGRPGPSAGDVDIYRLLLYNKRITTRALGRGEMVCTGIGAKGQSCTASYFLPQGQIVVQGVISSRLIYQLAVVGGTGLYNNVHGSLTVTSLHRKPNRELLVFRLVV